MDPINAGTISVVTAAMRSERDALVGLLGSLSADDWDRPTECAAWSVKGIASHLLGDDLSLLSRQRDGAMPGLVLVAESMPGADFRGLLNGFNEQWVEAARFFSVPLLIEQLRLSGEWTADYYTEVDPELPGEPVPMFNPAMDGPSPFWHAIGREYLERCAHHGQIRRALDLPSAVDADLLAVAARVVASAAGQAVSGPTDGDDDVWRLGPIVLGPTAQTADILTLAHTADEVRALVSGPEADVEQFAARVGRLNT